MGCVGIYILLPYKKQVHFYHTSEIFAERHIPDTEVAVLKYFDYKIFELTLEKRI